MGACGHEMGADTSSSPPAPSSTPKALHGLAALAARRTNGARGPTRGPLRISIVTGTFVGRLVSMALAAGDALPIADGAALIATTNGGDDKSSCENIGGLKRMEEYSCVTAWDWRNLEQVG